MHAARGGREERRKLIPFRVSGNFLRSRIRSSCGFASAGIRPLVRESSRLKSTADGRGDQSPRRGLAVGEKDGGEKKESRRDGRHSAAAVVA